MSDSPGIPREQFLARVREALGRSAPPAEPTDAPVVDEALVRLAGPGDDVVDLFARRAAEVGMDVRRCTGDKLARALTAVLEEIGASRVTTAVGSLPQGLAINEALRRKGVEVRAWQRDATMAAHYTADAGITDVHAAIAETGTLVCLADAGHGRGLSLVPAAHVAIVRAGDVVPDMLDAVALLRRRGTLPSAVAMITGPSKTADIEGILVTGVHGPGRVFILLVDDA